MNWRTSLAVGAVLLAAGSLRASSVLFTIEQNPGGDMFFNGDANKNVSSFTGTVGGQHAGPLVSVSSLGNVDTGAGFSTIKPVKGATLTSLTFTPANPNLFNDFSFRGQLLSAGSVTLSVLDNQGHTPQTFTFSNLPKDADFGRLGIVAVSGSGETIKSVTLTCLGFKEEKQNEFSYARAVPLPSALWGGLVLGVGLVAVSKRQRLSATGPTCAA